MGQNGLTGGALITHRQFEGIGQQVDLWTNRLDFLASLQLVNRSTHWPVGQTVGETARFLRSTDKE